VFAPAFSCKAELKTRGKVVLADGNNPALLKRPPENQANQGRRHPAITNTTPDFWPETS